MIRLTFHQPHPGGRILARLGSVDIGAIFPDPILPSAGWVFYHDRPSTWRTVPTIDRAKSHIAARAAQWVAALGLVQPTTQDVGGAR